MFRVNILIILFIILWQSEPNAQESVATTLHIDPMNAVGGTSSQIFEQINYIPLETTKESLFGKIDQLAVTEKYFIIRDRDTHSILVFGKDGKFHSKIHGGNEISYMWRFSIDRLKKEIVFVNEKDEFMHYDFEGKMIRKEKVSIERNDFYIFPKEIIAYSDYEVYRTHLPDSTRYELKFAQKNKIYKNDLPYNGKLSSLQSNEVMGSQHSPFYETGNDTSVFYCRPYDYGIYALSPSGISKKYNFILPLTNSLPAEFVTNALFSGKRFDYIMNKHKEVIFSITHFYKQKNHLFFKFNSFDNNSLNNDAFLYNLNSGNLMSITHVTSDSSNYFLPISSGNEFANDNFHTCDGEYLYTSQSSLEMFSAKEMNKDKKIKYNQVLENYFLKENKKSNPVILQIKPRSNL